jgi:hypothetical protein
MPKAARKNSTTRRTATLSKTAPEAPPARPVADPIFAAIENHAADEAGSTCSWLMVGFVAGLKIGSAAIKQRKPVCLPDNFSSDQLKFILDIVRDAPHDLDLPAIPGLTVPLQAAYPCRRAN